LGCCDRHDLREPKRAISLLSPGSPSLQAAFRQGMRHGKQNARRAEERMQGSRSAVAQQSGGPFPIADRRRTKITVGVGSRDRIMAGLAREGARLAAEVRIKYVDSQADATQRLTEGIMPIVSSGNARMIFVRSRGIRLFYAPLSSAELEHSTTVFSAGPGRAWCSKGSCQVCVSSTPYVGSSALHLPPDDREALPSWRPWRTGQGCQRER
jgi:hypothetical protein